MRPGARGFDRDARERGAASGREARTARRRVLTTLEFEALRSWAHGSPLEVHSLETRTPPARAVLRRVVSAAPNYDAVLLNGSGRRDQLAAALIRRRRTPPVVVITDCTWKRGASPLERAASRAGLRALEGPAVFYCVLSSAESELFPRTWGVDPARVFFTAYHHTLREDELAHTDPAGDGVFAGGDSMRDYRPLIEAARSVPAEITVATRDASLLRQGLPANVRAGPLPHERFLERMRAARVVVVPLIDSERSAGQQTYLNAMAMGKIVIATDTPGVRDYIAHGETGLVVPPRDAAAMAEALRWAVDPANEPAARDMRARARDVVRTEFTPDRYVARVLRVVESVLA